MRARQLHFPFRPRRDPHRRPAPKRSSHPKRTHSSPPSLAAGGRASHRLCRVDRAHVIRRGPRDEGVRGIGIVPIRPRVIRISTAPYADNGDSHGLLWRCGCHDGSQAVGRCDRINSWRCCRPASGYGPDSVDTHGCNAPRGCRCTHGDARDSNRPPSHWRATPGSSRQSGEPWQLGSRVCRDRRGKTGRLLSLSRRNQPHGSDLGACRSDIVAAGEDHPFSVALQRPRRRVPAAIREPQDGPVWLRSRLCQRVGPWRVREAAHQMRRMSQPSVPSGH